MGSCRVLVAVACVLAVGSCASPTDPTTSSVGLPRCPGVDGVQLVYGTGSTPISDVAGDLFGIDDDGSIRKLTDLREAYEPSFAPDGRTIVFIRQADVPAGSVVGTDGLWAMDANGENERQLLAAVGARHPSYSADGASIVYTVGVGREPKLVHVVDADGGNSRRLTADVAPPEGFLFAGEKLPVFRPDDRAIAFVRHFEDRDGVILQQVIVLDLTTGQERIVHETNASVEPVTWSPDGGQLLVGDFDPPFAAADRTHVLQTVQVGAGDVVVRARNAWGGTYAGDSATVVFFFTLPSSEEDTDMQLLRLDTGTGGTTEVLDFGQAPWSSLSIPYCASE